MLLGKEIDRALDLRRLMRLSKPTPDPCLRVAIIHRVPAQNAICRILDEGTALPGVEMVTYDFPTETFHILLHACVVQGFIDQLEGEA